MSINILMPALSPTMTEGKLAKWHVKVGDTVKSGQVICEIETDKATMEVEAVDEGKIGQIVVPEGTEGVKVNAVIAVLLEEGETEVEGAAPRRRRCAGAAKRRSRPAGRSAAAPRSRRRAKRRRRSAPARSAGATAPSGRAHLRLAARQAHRRARRASISRASRARARTAASSRPTSRTRKPGAAAPAPAAAPKAAPRRAPRRRQPIVAAPGDTRIPHTADAQGHRAAHARVQADRAALLPDGGLEIDALLAARAGDQRRRAEKKDAKRLGQRHGDQGLRQGAARSSRVQRLVDRGRDDPVRRGRHLGRRRHRPRPDHADRPQRRHEGRGADLARDEGPRRARQGRQAEARRVPGRRLHHLQPRHVRHQGVRRRSSTRRRP